MPDVDVQKAVEDLGRAVEEFKTTNDTILEKKADKSAVDVLLKEKLDRVQDTLDKTTASITAAQTELKAERDRIDQLETTLARSGTGGEDQEENKAAKLGALELIRTDLMDSGVKTDVDLDSLDDLDIEAFKRYDRSFQHYIRKGSGAFLTKMGLPGLEVKLLSVDRDPGGGYWVRPTMSARITKIVFETSPMRQVAAVENIGSDSLELIADENQVAFGWVAEQDTRAQTDTADIAKRVIHAHEIYAEPRATQKLLDDAGFNVENWLSDKIADRFARAEAAAYVTGTGVGQPRGFTTYPSGTATGQVEQVNSGDADDLTADGLINLLYSLKSPYLNNAMFLAARLTIRDIRKLKDGQGRYLWEPRMQGERQPQALLGYPIRQADDMAAVSAGNEPVAFGDFRAGYTIVDRLGIRTVRDPFTAKPFIKFYTTKRTGGDVVNFEAIKLQTISA